LEKEHGKTTDGPWITPRKTYPKLQEEEDVKPQHQDPKPYPQRDSAHPLAMIAEILELKAKGSEHRK
jgi:hypothetical protein